MKELESTLNFTTPKEGIRASIIILLKNISIQLKRFLKTNLNLKYTCPEIGGNYSFIKTSNFEEIKILRENKFSEELKMFN